jgi:hypothetical protein
VQVLINKIKKRVSGNKNLLFRQSIDVWVIFTACAMLVVTYERVYTDIVPKYL